MKSTGSVFGFGFECLQEFLSFCVVKMTNFNGMKNWIGLQIWGPDDGGSRTAVYHIRQNCNEVGDVTTLEQFLDINRPSVLCKRSDIGVPWIWIVNDKLIPAKMYDCDAMARDWKEIRDDICNLGRGVEHQNIWGIANKYGLCSGRWIFFSTSNTEADTAINSVARDLVAGGLANVAMAISAHISANHAETFLMSVYHEDENQIELVEKLIRKAGVTVNMKYKPDIYSHFGIKRERNYGLKETILRSHYNVDKGESTIFRTYAETEKNVVLKLTAEELAAESLARTFEEKITFVVGRDNEGLTVEDWVAKYQPSSVLEKPGIGAISVMNDLDVANDEDQYQKLIQLQQYWEDVKSNEQIDYNFICNVAENFDVKSGKWFFWENVGYKADILWKIVARGIVNGRLGRVATSANISCTIRESREFVIKIHNKNFMDTDEVYKLEDQLRAAGVMCKMMYKPEIYSLLGFYRGNDLLRPTVYESVYDIRLRKSTVTRSVAMITSCGWITHELYDEKSGSVENFLSKYPPSKVERTSGVDWICIRKEDNSVDVDLEKLLDEWDEHESEKRPIDYWGVCDLAAKYKYTSGKWLFYALSGAEVDSVWKIVVEGIAEGELGTVAKTAKVSPFVKPEFRQKQAQHVICVYNENFLDKERVYLMERLLRKAGIENHLMYKPDIFTHLGIYAKNPYGLRPTIYNSRYDQLLRTSSVTANYPEARPATVKPNPITNYFKRVEG